MNTKIIEKYIQFAIDNQLIEKLLGEKYGKIKQFFRKRKMFKCIHNWTIDEDGINTSGIEYGHCTKCSAEYFKNLLM